MSSKKEKAKRKAAHKEASKEIAEGKEPVLVQAPHVTLHRKKFMGGRYTPDEVHAALGVAKPCRSCKRPGVVVIRSLCTEKDYYIHVNAHFQAIAALATGGRAPTFPTKYGPMVVLSEVAACRSCAPALERAAAKHPSWVLIEINRGPKPIPIQSGYGGPSTAVH